MRTHLLGPERVTCGGTGGPEAFEFLDPGALSDGELTLVLAERFRGDPNIGYVPAYQFAIVESLSGAEVGRIVLRIGDLPRLVLYGGHIGYWIDPAYRGHHYAARACKLLTGLACRHCLRELWITCNPDNLASRRTCELAGATLVEIVDLPADSEMYQRGERQKCRYRLDLGGAD